MNSYQYRAWPNGANGCPSLFRLRRKIAMRDCIRIIKNEHGSLEANIVLAKVLAVFALIPLKSHRAGSFK